MTVVLSVHLPAVGLFKARRPAWASPLFLFVGNAELHAGKLMEPPYPSPGSRFLHKRQTRPPRMHLGLTDSVNRQFKSIAGGQIRTSFCV